MTAPNAAQGKSWLGRGWSRWRRLSPLARRCLLSAWCLLPLMWLSLWVLGLPRLQAWLTRRTLRTADLALDQVAELGQAVNLAARLSPGPVTCLSRSLLLGWLLRRQGVASQLRLGVQLGARGQVTEPAQALKAHAWIEVEGVPVNDRDNVAQDFAPFDHLGRLARFDR